jgi:hypothetical protein
LECCERGLQEQHHQGQRWREEFMDRFHLSEKKPRLLLPISFEGIGERNELGDT